MTALTCPKCGFNEAAMVKKEVAAGGSYHRKFRCPRCSHTWESTE